MYVILNFFIYPFNIIIFMRNVDLMNVKYTFQRFYFVFQSILVCATFLTCRLYKVLLNFSYTHYICL